MKPHHASPGVRFPPPLIYLGILLAGWGIGHLAGEPSLGLNDTARRAVAVVLIVLGLSVDGLAAGQMRRHQTAIEPWKGASRLLQTGLFGFSRNPIYLGFTITYAGFAVAMDSPVALALMLVAIIVIDRLVIPREEAHLSAVFGAEYDSYRQKVRRWL